MMPFGSQRKRLAAVIGPCVLGLLLVPIAQHQALASPDVQPSLGNAGAVNLRLDRAGATRVMADLSGAAQEGDSEKPKSMEEKATEPAPGAASAVKKEAPPPDPFAFVKDWPFWVIVGGAVIAGAATYMLLRNSNEQGPCSPSFNGGCFGER